MTLFEGMRLVWRNKMEHMEKNEVEIQFQIIGLIPVIRHQTMTDTVVMDDLKKEWIWILEILSDTMTQRK